MEQYGIPVSYVFANDEGKNTVINVLHTTKQKVNLGDDALPKFEVHSSTSKQILKNKNLSDTSNLIVASSVRMGDGSVMMFPEAPRKGEAAFVVVNGKPAWKGTNDDKINAMMSSVDNMMKGFTNALETVFTRLSDIETKLNEIGHRVDKRFEEFEEVVDINTIHADIARLKSDVGIINDLVDGVTPDVVSGGKPLTTKSAKTIVSDSNPTVKDGKVHVTGKITDIVGALCRLSYNNNVSVKKQEESE